MPVMRLDKIISEMGIASRRDVKSLIKNGRVLVDNNVVKNSDIKVDTEKARITVDGKEVYYKEFRYIMLNKPAGFICATEDTHEITVMELLSDELKRQKLFSVGRLDKDTEGLLIMTNDGDYAHKVISPKSDIVKKYYAKVSAPLEENDIYKMKSGIVLGDGTKCLPAGLEILSEYECTVSVSEGKYHQVKRMLASIGKHVEYLKRISIGGLKLDEKLVLGQWRELDEDEIKSSLNTES